MVQTYSKSRLQAEIAFGKAQSQLVARQDVGEERDSLVLAREEKTMRLRKARLAKELVARDAVMSKRA